MFGKLHTLFFYSSFVFAVECHLPSETKVHIHIIFFLQKLTVDRLLKKSNAAAARGKVSF